MSVATGRGKPGAKALEYHSNKRGNVTETVSGTNGTVKHKSIFTADLRRPKAVVGGGLFLVT